MSLRSRGTGDATTVGAEVTTTGRVARGLGGALAVLGVVVDPRLFAVALLVWFLYALYAVASG